MTDLDKILATAAATVASGALVLMAGQIVIRFLIEPLQEQRRVLGAIAAALLRSAPVLADSGDESAAAKAAAFEAAQEFRRLSIDLVTQSWAIRPYGALAALCVVPSWGDVASAASSLVGLSNFAPRPDFQQKIKLAQNVAARLGMRHIDPMFDDRNFKA